MIRTSGSVVIDRPADEVFAYVTDLRGAREWSPQMGQIVDAGAMTRGARFHERRSLFGVPTKGTWLVTEYDAGRRVGIHVRYGPIRMDYGMTITPESASSSRAAYDATLDLGALSFAERLMAADFRKEEAAEIERLKRILEERRPG